MRCSCSACEGPHHHAFGGTYPCEGPQACSRCHDYDLAVWRDELDMPPVHPHTPLADVQRAQAGLRYIRQRYGPTTGRWLTGH